MDFELEIKFINDLNHAFMLEKMLLSQKCLLNSLLESILSNEYAKNIQVFYLYQVTNKNVHRMLQAQVLWFIIPTDGNYKNKKMAQFEW